MHNEILKYSEIKWFIQEEWFSKQYKNIYDNFTNIFYEERKTGENGNYICKLNIWKFYFYLYK